MLRSIPPTDPVLLLATAECEKDDLPQALMRDFFGFSRKNQMEIPRPQQVSLTTQKEASFDASVNADSLS